MSSRRAGCCAGASTAIWSGCWDPSGVVGRAVVHLTDTRLFLLARLGDVLLGEDRVSGLDLPGSEATATGDGAASAPERRRRVRASRWQRFLVAAGNVLRTNSRWIPATVVEDFEHAMPVAWCRRHRLRPRASLRLLSSSAGRARSGPPLRWKRIPASAAARATATGADPGRTCGWGADHPKLRVVHDEQSALTRVASRRDRATAWLASRPVTRSTWIRVDSREDPRVQLADLVAGIARRAAVGLLSGRPDAELLDLVRPVVDPLSVWADDFWGGRARSRALGVAGGRSQAAVIADQRGMKAIRSAGHVLAGWPRVPVDPTVRSSCLSRASYR